MKESHVCSHIWLYHCSPTHQGQACWKKNGPKVAYCFCRFGFGADLVLSLAGRLFPGLFPEPLEGAGTVKEPSVEVNGIVGALSSFERPFSAFLSTTPIVSEYVIRVKIRGLIRGRSLGGHLNPPVGGVQNGAH